MTEFPQPQTPATAPTPRGRFARTVAALMLREMSGRYGRSPGGYIWAVAEPLGMILLLSIGFSLVMRAPRIGDSFILFYATGYLPFNMYQGIARRVASSMTYSRGLLAYPAVSWFDAVTARLLLNALTQLLVSYILMLSILVITQSTVTLDFGAIFMSYGFAIMIGTGVGLINCTLFGLIPVWQQFFAILSRPLFLASGVLLLFESLPPLAQQILWWNPLFHVTGLGRSGFFGTYRAEYVSILYVLGFALVLIAFGLMLTRRYHAQALARS